MRKDWNLQDPAPAATRKRRAVIGVSAATLVAFAGVGALAAGTNPNRAAAATTSGSALQQGAYVSDNDPVAMAAFGAATDTAPTVGSDYLPGSAGWAGMDGSGGSLSWLTGPWSGSSYTLSLGVPILPTSSSGAVVGTLATGATGAYNSYFVTLAQTLVSAGESTAYLRLGWEFDGGWYSWSATTPTSEASYAAYFDQIVSAMRSVPGENFSFVWNPDAGAFSQSGYNVALAYPGSAYVNVIGLDAYDQTWVTPQTPANTWNQTVLPGLNAATNFAQSQGKPLAITEWGVATRSDGHGLGDDPLYVNNFIAWMQNPVNNVAFESYFNVDVSGQDDAITDGTFPNSLAAFSSDFGGSSTSPPVTPPTTTTSAPVTPPVTVSAPGAVTHLTGNVEGTSVSLRWTNPSGAQGDKIYINGVLKVTLNSAATSYTLTNAPSGWHSYNVEAFNAAGHGAASNTVTNWVR